MLIGTLMAVSIIEEVASKPKFPTVFKIDPIPELSKKLSSLPNLSPAIAICSSIVAFGNSIITC